MQLCQPFFATIAKLITKCFAQITKVRMINTYRNKHNQ